MNEESIAPPNATLVRDFTKQHGFGTYLLGLKGVEYDMNANVSFIAFPRDTPQKSGSFGSSVPTELGKYVSTPYRLNAKKGFYHFFPVGTLSNYRSELWIFPPMMSGLDNTFKQTPLYQFYEGILAELETTNRENELLKEQAKISIELMQEYSGGEITQATWDKFMAFAKSMAEMQQREPPKPHTSEPQKQW